MPNFYDVGYTLGLATSAPIWASRSKSRKKVLSALNQRRGQTEPRPGNAPAILIHAVSLGEVNATPLLFLCHMSLRLVIA